MTRLSLILLLFAAIGACAGPIETRVANTGYEPITGAKQYDFAVKQEQGSSAYKAAQSALSSTLANRGYTLAEDAPLLVEIALSNRPADIAVSIGGDTKVKSIAPAKERKLLQSCADREYRLKILFIDRSTGEASYSGAASEYHCKATIEETLPHLLEAALSDLGTTHSETRIQTREGVE